MVDESHSAGVVGPTGHGVSEQYGTYGRVDIYTGTLGKAFGGALGGFTTGRKEIIDLLRQRSRPYLLQLIGSGYYRCQPRSIQNAEREQYTS